MYVCMYVIAAGKEDMFQIERFSHRHLHAKPVKVEGD